MKNDLHRVQYLLIKFSSDECKTLPQVTEKSLQDAKHVGDEIFSTTTITFWIVCIFNTS